MPKRKSWYELWFEIKSNDNEFYFDFLDISPDYIISVYLTRINFTDN